MMQERSQGTRVKVRRAARGCRPEQLLEPDGAHGPALIQIHVNNGPISGIATSPDGTRLMVANYGSDSVSVIDTGSCRVVETIAEVNEPFAIATDGQDAGRTYVSTVSTAYDSITVIDGSTNAVVASHPLALTVSDLVVGADGKHVYASRNDGRGADVVVLDTMTGEVEEIDLAELCDLALGATTECVRISPDGGRLYVGTNGPAGGRLVVLGMDERGDESDQASRTSWRRKKPKKSGGPPENNERSGWRVVETLEIGLPIRDVALSPNGALGTFVYVASCCPELGAVVDVVDTRANEIAVTRKIGEISGNITGFTLSGDGGRAYLVGDDGVTVLCMLTLDVIGTVETGGQPSCVAESADGKHLYIADYSGAVTVAPMTATAWWDIGEAIESEPSVEAADWDEPELLRYEPVLA
jgi:YVTN family beta-propeller protein